MSSQGGLENEAKITASCQLHLSVGLVYTIPEQKEEELLHNFQNKIDHLTQVILCKR